MADVVKVVNGGLGLVTAALLGSTHKYVAWGIGVTAADAADTALETASAPTNVTAVTGDATQQTTTSTNDTYQVVATITADSTLAITEVGILNQATVAGATMFLHGTFDPIKVNSGDSIQFTIKTVFVQA